MTIRRIEKTIRAVEDRLHRLARRLDAPDARRLRALLGRHQTLLLAVALAVGILLMMIHWSGSVEAAPDAHAHGAAHGNARHEVVRVPSELPRPRLQGRAH